MMYDEFLELSGQEISYKQYTEIIEPMYMAADMSKQEFIKFIIPSCRALAKAYKESKPKDIRKMLVRDRSGCRKTPNGCWYHIEYVEWIGVDIATGKHIVGMLTEKDFQKLAAEGRDLDHSTDYDFDYVDCIDKKHKPVVLSWL